MSADSWLAAEHRNLPLLHTPLSELLLPGEAAQVYLERAEELAARPSRYGLSLWSIQKKQNSYVVDLLS